MKTRARAGGAENDNGRTKRDRARAELAARGALKMAGLTDNAFAPSVLILVRAVAQREGDRATVVWLAGRAREFWQIIADGMARSGGQHMETTPEDGLDGAVVPWPEAWGELTPDKTCGWGGQDGETECDNQAKCARYDASACAWLPCCEVCEQLPLTRETEEGAS